MIASQKKPMQKWMVTTELGTMTAGLRGSLGNSLINPHVEHSLKFIKNFSWCSGSLYR